MEPGTRSEQTASAHEAVVQDAPGSEVAKEASKEAANDAPRREGPRPADEGAGWRWWPDSFGSQLLALLIGGLVLSHLIGLWVLSDDAGRIHPRSSLATGDLFVRVYRTITPMAAEPTAAMLAAMSDNKMRFERLDRASLASAPTADAMAASSPTPRQGPDEGARSDARAGNSSADGDVNEPTAQRTWQLVERHLGLGPQALRVCAGTTCPSGDEPTALVHRVSDRAMAPILIEARLPDGHWLRVTAWSELRQQWWWPISFWLQLSLVPVFVAVAFVMHRMLRPWRQLVGAANRASRGERIEPLPITGPREMRDILRAFNEMQRRITRFLDDRTRMLAALSHDFRRPLTSLRLWADLVDDDSLRAPMVRTLGEMRTMVDETLGLMRDEVALENTVEVSLRELLDQVIDEHAALDLDVAWAALPASAFPYRCRPIALKRAFANIVDNAVRHGGGARLDLRRRDRQAGQDAIEVLIDDTGPGMSPERLAALLEPGADGHAGAAPASAGSSARPGLGLAIARMFARAHGGELTLQPGPNQRGLRATFLLPVN